MGCYVYYLYVEEEVFTLINEVYYDPLFLTELDFYANQNEKVNNNKLKI